MTPADERPHDPGPGQLWSESWYLDFATGDGRLGGYVRVGLLPNLGVSWYWACVVGRDRPLVAVLDHDVPLPRPRGSLEVRSEGLWADHTVETPFDHFTLGCEAFAVGVDDPVEVYGGDLRGDRVPLGLDLEWESDGGVHAGPGEGRYQIPCTVSGEILLGDEEVDFDGTGLRDHCWGERDWWSSGWCWTAGRLDDGTRFHGLDAPVPDHGGSGGSVAEPGGRPPATPAAMSVGVTDGEDGLPAAARIGLGDVDLAVTPVAHAPVLVTSPSGELSHLARCLSRFEAGDGRRGVGWTEWNRPRR